MIDFIKVYSHDKSHTHILKEKFDLKTEVNVKTGEVTDIHTGVIENGYKLTVYPSGRIAVMGSLHKAFNNGTSDSDFTHEQLVTSINNFTALFELPPQSWILQNVEYGVNIPLPYDPSFTLSNIVSLRTGATFSPMQGKGLTGKGSQCNLWDYRHKIYNKSAQYGLDDYLLRYELHNDKMRRIPTVKTLQDLPKLQVWESISSSLLYHANQIIFTDDLNLNLLANSPDKHLLKYIDKFNNSRYWKRLEPYQRNRQLKNLNKILSYGNHQIAATFKNELRRKVNQLITSARISPFK